jgi:hypothetical protein
MNTLGEIYHLLAIEDKYCRIIFKDHSLHRNVLSGLIESLFREVIYMEVERYTLKTKSPSDLIWIGIGGGMGRIAGLKMIRMKWGLFSKALFPLTPQSQ